MGSGIALYEVNIHISYSINALKNAVIICYLTSTGPVTLHVLAAHQTLTLRSCIVSHELCVDYQKTSLCYLDCLPSYMI